MPQFDYEIKAGATGEALTMGLVKSNNSAVDITGVKGGTFRLKDRDSGTVIKSNGSLTVTDSVNGYFQHSWLKAETSGRDNSTLLGEAWLTLSDDSILKLPQAGYITIRVGAPIQ